MQRSPDYLTFSAHIIQSVVIGAAICFLGLQIRDAGGIRLAQIAPTGAVPLPGRPMAQQPEAAPPAFDQAKLDPSVSKGFLYGSRSARFSLISYMDFECPYCARFYPVAKQMVDASHGTVNLVFRPYPLSFHAHASYLANAAECIAEEKGPAAFWSYSDRVFEGSAAQSDVMQRYASAVRELHVNDGALKRCIESGRFSAAIQHSLEGGTAIGVLGTPSTVIVNHSNGKAAMLAGVQDLDRLRAKIDSLQ